MNAVLDGSPLGYKKIRPFLIYCPSSLPANLLFLNADDIPNIAEYSLKLNLYFKSMHVLSQRELSRKIWTNLFYRPNERCRSVQLSVEI